MGQRCRYVGCWLLFASSLGGFGCDALKPRRADRADYASWELVKPAVGPALQMPSPVIEPGPDNSASHDLSDQSNGHPSLLPPISESDHPIRREGSEIAANPALAPLRRLYHLATERYAATPVYSVRLLRREQVDGKQRPEELIQLKYRQQPASLAMRWLGNEAKNRELVYVKSRDDDMLRILPGIHDPLTSATAVRSLITRPDSSQGLGMERYPVLETGIGPLIDRFGRLIAAVERDDKTIGAVKFLGSIQRPEFEAPLDAVVHLIPAGIDGSLAKGGQRIWYFDPLLHFPVLIIAHDAQGKEAEYYRFDRFLFPARIADDEFDALKLGRH